MVIVYCGHRRPRLISGALDSTRRFTAPLLTDQEVRQHALAYVRKQYGQDWVPDKGVALADPPGMFFWVKRSDGTDYTGTPSPFFIYRDAGTCVPVEQNTVSRSFFDIYGRGARATDAMRVFMDREHPDHAQVCAPVIVESLRLAGAPGPASTSRKPWWRFW